MKACRGLFLPGALVLALTVVVGPDSTLTQLPGYGGVLPLPFASEEMTSAVARLEILSPRGGDTRQERGRVLYANDRGTRSVETARASREKRPCTASLAPSRTPATPNS